MSHYNKADPRKGHYGDLGEWLSKPRNREKMYRSDREDAKELSKMGEVEGGVSTHSQPSKVNS